MTGLPRSGPRLVLWASLKGRVRILLLTRVDRVWSWGRRCRRGRRLICLLCCATTKKRWKGTWRANKRGLWWAMSWASRILRIPLVSTGTILRWRKGLVLIAALLDASGGARACGCSVLDA